MAKASDNVFPRFLISEGGSTSTPASGRVTMYAKADGLLYSKDDAGVETLVSGGGGGGIDSGTSFPGGPSTGDLFHRTNLAVPLWRYDGTRWLCTCQHELSSSNQDALNPLAATATIGRWAVRQDFGMYLDRLTLVTLVSTTNNGTNFWTVAFARRDAANGNTDIVSLSTGTGPDTASNWVNHDQAIGAVLDSGARELQLTATKTLSPGNAHVIGAVVYRLIGT